MNTTDLREKSSQNGRIYFGVLRDEKNRRFVSLTGGIN